ncbi:hypothetical protein AJ88_19605 [Mesorhizobium amorphae CCBAU 01583]|nr:hypothetical protein AJ88_19605 [Mesorhizobium amorphae CCBAU 01583]
MRTTKFEIGTAPCEVCTLSSSSVDSVRLSSGRRSRMSTASSAPAGLYSESFSPLVTNCTTVPTEVGLMPYWAALARSTSIAQSTPGGGRPSEMSMTPGTLAMRAATARALSSSPSGSAAESLIWIGLPVGGPASGTRTSTSTPGMPAMTPRKSFRMSFADLRSRQSTNSYWITPTTSSGMSWPPPCVLPTRV